MKKIKKKKRNQPQQILIAREEFWKFSREEKGDPFGSV